MAVLTSQTLLAQTGSRYALVIGNAEYQRIEKLKNTTNDAYDIGDALQSLGYQVDLKFDLGHLDMVDAVESFVTKLASNRSNEGFFWYAGHAVQIRDENFLLPVDITIDSESRVRAGSYSLNSLIDALHNARNKVNVLVLDSCRDNPLPASGRSSGSTRGLSIISDLPADLFVMFSTAPGNKADDGEPGKRNSPFAEAFLKYIHSTEPVYQMAIDVTNETMNLTGKRQQPFNRGSIISEKYYSLNPDAVPPSDIIIARPINPSAPERINVSGSKNESITDKTKLWTLGVSLGSTLADPWFVGTIHGTVAPFPYSFIDIGFDLGLVSGIQDATNYFSLFPFVHLAFFLPFADAGGWYIGTGGGYMYSKYTFPDENIPMDIFTGNFTTGFNIGNFLDISYTLRTNFSLVNNKISVGFVYRF